MKFVSGMGLLLVATASVAVEPLLARGEDQTKAARANVRSKGVIVLQPKTGSPPDQPTVAPNGGNAGAQPSAVVPNNGNASISGGASGGAMMVAPVVPARPVAPTPAPIRPVIKECARPFAAPDLALADAAPPAAPVFDKALGSKLKGKKRVVLDLPQPYKLGGTPPAALVPWFTEVRASGGTVTVSQYCQGARGFLGNFLSKLFGSRPANPYKVIDGYNAVLHVNALDGQVTQLEFTPREPGKRS